MESTQSFDQARQITYIWLKDQKMSASKLAKLTKLHRSVITRFLNGRLTSPTTAARIFEVIQPSLSVTERVSLMEAFGLSRFSNLTQSVQTATYPSLPYATELTGYRIEINSLIGGAQLLAKASSISSTAPAQAAQLCFLAEKAYGDFPDGALMAARIGVQLLININCLEDADQELSRLRAVYDAQTDLHTQLRLQSAQGWLQYDRGEIDGCIHTFEHQRQVAEAAGFLSELEESHHFLALCYLAIGRRTLGDSVKGPHERLQAALKHIDVANSMSYKHDAADCHYGFGHYRKGQILDALRRSDEANSEFTQARRLFAEEARQHLDIHLSEHWLDNGDTKKAKVAAESALFYSHSLQYATGLSRAARVLAQSQMQEGKIEDALEHAIAAACFDPYSWFGFQMQPIHSLVRELSDIVKRQHSKLSYAQYIARTRTKLDERQGIFEHLSRIAADRKAAINKIFQLAT